MSLFEPVRFQARVNPDRLALVGFASLREPQTYRQFVALIENTARYLVLKGASDGQRIGVKCEDTLVYLAAILALSHLGVGVIVMLDGARAGASLDAIVTDKPQALGGTKTIVLDLDALAKPVGRESGVDAHQVGQSVLTFPHQAADTNARADLSIGKDLLRARVFQRLMTKGGDGSNRWLSAVPLDSELGLSAALECLWSGRTFMVSSGKLEDDIQPMGLYGADQLLLPASLIGDYLRVLERVSTLRPPIRHVVVAGRVFDEESVRRLKRHVANDAAIHLDCPEAGTFAVSASWSANEPRRYYALPGVVLRVGDGIEGLSAKDAQGAVTLKSLSMIQPVESGPLKAHFQDGWFDPRLSGSLAEDGSLLLSPLDSRRSLRGE